MYYRVLSHVLSMQCGTPFREVYYRYYRVLSVYYLDIDNTPIIHDNTCIIGVLSAAVLHWYCDDNTSIIHR